MWDVNLLEYCWFLKERNYYLDISGKLSTEFFTFFIGKCASLWAASRRWDAGSWQLFRPYYNSLEWVNEELRSLR